MKLENYGKWTCCDCPDGQKQSPVNVSGSQEGGACEIAFDYRPFPLAAIDTGHSVQFNDDAHRCHIVYQGTDYELQQFHFHYPAEHTINGLAFQMELHLVHWHEDAGYLVVAVMMACGGTAHPGYETLWAHLPGGLDADNHDLFNPLGLLPRNHHSHFTYSGSLTTPPCTENVRWVILEQPVALSQAQLDTFGALYTGNNRPLQNLNGRIIRHHS